MNFTRKDILVIFLYILLVCVQLWGIDMLKLPEAAMMTVRLIVILLNAFIVIYAYRGVLSVDWQMFRRHKWTKWLIIIATFAVVTLFLTVVRRLMAGSVDDSAVVEAASETVSEAVSDTPDDVGEIINPFKAMPLYTFILSLLAALVPLLSAVTEEVMFRHVLMFKHSGKVLRYVLLVVSSVLFGLIHFKALGSVGATIPYIFVALIFGSLYLWKKNIWYNIFAHMLFNGMNVAMGVFTMISQRFFS